LHAPITHTPLAHVGTALANWQRTPQPPQSFTSLPLVAVSQPSSGVPLQSPKPGSQPPTTHALATHALVAAWGRAHAVPQAPQLRALVVVSTHELAQFIKPVPHEVVHAPPEQTSPAPHVWPHAPQW
jgi:hypothetical protein